jgi:hypothetical protein
MRVIEDKGACRDDILDIVEDTVTFTHFVDSFAKVVCFEFEDCVLAQSQNWGEMIFMKRHENRQL